MLKPGLVRFILASIVVLFHVAKVVYLGTLAVYCFFILSGYWISLMYDLKYAKLNSPVQEFYTSRLYRLFPVYYLFIALTAVVTLIFDFDKVRLIADMPLVKQLAFWLSNITLLGYNQLMYKPIAPAWSLDIEVQFYILFPLVILLMGKRINRVVTLLGLALVAIIIETVFQNSFLHGTVLPYLVYFAIGISLNKDKIVFSRTTQLICNLLFVAVLLVHYLSPGLFQLVKDSETSYHLHFSQLASLLLVPLLAGSVRVKSNKLDRALGDMSYVLYLSHWVWFIPYNHYIQNLTTVQRLPYMAAYLVLTFAMAYLFYRYYDRPIEERRRRLAEQKELSRV
ncbi:acyltransferase family protein [Hymenobacter cavernae]|nr:acyltransferase [Hymenobacter cavernae]